MRVVGAPWGTVQAHEPWFRVMLARLPDDDVEALLRDIEARDRQAWVVDGKAVVLTQLKETPKGRVLDITHCAGDRMDLWADAIADFEHLAREARCVSVEATGRPGWARIGRAHGYKTHRVTVTKDL